MTARILVVDDSAEVRELLRYAFKLGEMRSRIFEISEAANAVSAAAMLQGPQPDVVLLDVVLPDGNGLTLLPQIKRQWPETQVVLMTGALDSEGKLNAAVEATKKGAFHFLSKPINGATLTITVERALETKRAAEERRQLREGVVASGGLRPVFRSAAMRAVIATVEKVAASDVSMLITGETGTGKEIITHAVHMLSPRAAGPLVKVNCAALPRELIEGELFGALESAYPEAPAGREGLFRQAAGGTLLLDELCEMPVETQCKLLRVLQDREVRPVGGNGSYRADCRVLATTNRKIETALREGRLREDLFHRVGQITVELPPLRERREDILPLAQLFLKVFSAQAGKHLTGLTATAAERLSRFDWPGNVRQLQNEMQRAVLLCETAQVDTGDLSIEAEPPQSPNGTSSFSLLEGVERNAIALMLNQTGGNKLEAARRLGIGRQTLYNKIRLYGIKC